MSKVTYECDDLTIFELIYKWKSKSQIANKLIFMF